MTCFVDVAADGRIVAWGTGVAPADLRLPQGATRRFHVADDRVDDEGSYAVGTSLRPKPPRPTPHHVFDYTTKQWVLDVEATWAAVRATRDERLAATDWVVLRAADQGTPVPPEWMAYRQALRDVTEQPGFPEGVVWPTPPDA